MQMLINKLIIFVKNFEIIVTKILKNNIQPEKEEFLDKLSKTR